MRVFILLVALFFFASCSEPVPEVPPSDLIAKDQFTEVMVDVQLIEGMKIHKLGPKRSKSPDMELMYSEIFQKHDITQEEFKKTYDYYKSKPNQMELIYESVLDSLSKLDVEVKKTYNAPKNGKSIPDLDSVRKSVSKRHIEHIKSETEIEVKDTTKNK
ncbi:MAG: DUF4296 domain-containing protein [Bacteroidota bacterium]